MEKIKVIQEALSMGLSLSYKNIISIDLTNNGWQVKYESYFNPHTNPNQLMDYKDFDNYVDAAEFFLNYLESRWREDF